MAYAPLQFKPGMKTPQAGTYVVLDEAGVELKRVEYEAGRRFPPVPKGAYYVLAADAPERVAPAKEEKKDKKQNKDKKGKKKGKNKSKKKDKKKKKKKKDKKKGK